MSTLTRRGVLRTAIVTSLVLVATVANTQPFAIPRLLVTSTKLDKEAHRLTVELSNTAQSPAVAYALKISEPSGDHQLLTDGVYAFAYPDDPAEAAQLRTNWIMPGKSVTRSFAVGQNTDFAQATVTAVVYADRKAEGEEKVIRMFFNSRAEEARRRTTAEASATAMHRGVKTKPDVAAKELELQSRRVQ